MSPVFLFAKLIGPPVKGQIHLVGEEIMGCAARITCRTVFVDDATVFAIFLMVRSPCSNPLPF